LSKIFRRGNDHFILRKFLGREAHFGERKRAPQSILQRKRFFGKARGAGGKYSNYEGEYRGASYIKHFFLGAPQIIRGTGGLLEIKSAVFIIREETNYRENML